MRATSSRTTNAKPVVIASTDIVLPFKSAKRFTDGDADDGQESAVAAHECEQIRIVGNLRFALPLPIGDDIVENGEREIDAAFEQRVDQERRGRRVGELHAQALGIEEALPLRRPDRKIPAAIEGDDAKRDGGSGLRLRVKREGNDASSDDSHHHAYCHVTAPLPRSPPSSMSQRQ